MFMYNLFLTWVYCFTYGSNKANCSASYLLVLVNDDVHWHWPLDPPSLLQFVAEVLDGKLKQVSWSSLQHGDGEVSQHLRETGRDINAEVTSVVHRPHFLSPTRCRSRRSQPAAEECNVVVCASVRVVVGRCVAVVWLYVGV